MKVTPRRIWIVPLALVVLVLPACGAASPGSPAASGGGSISSSAGSTAKPTAAPSQSGGAAKPAGAASQSAVAQGKDTLTTVHMGTLVPSASDAAWLIADTKGWFAEQGLRIDRLPFKSGTEMIPPLGTNQIDVGGGVVSAGIFNAVTRGIDLAIAADKGSTPPGHGYQALLVRKDLVDSGKFKSTADLRGMKVASPGAGGFDIGRLLHDGGLAVKDVDVVQLAFADMVPAFANKSIDAADITEPYLTQTVQEGLAVAFKHDDEYAPNEQVAVIMYSPTFVQNRDVSTRFMTAYLKGARLYNDAFGQKKDPQARKEVVTILSQATSIKDQSLYEKMTMPGLNPNGTVNLSDLEQQQQYYIQIGDQKQSVDLKKVVDSRSAEAAVKILGAYS